jgi:hypothetical protein
VLARTVPKGASIAVDGVVLQQQTPARLDLAAGQHLIVFSIAGYTAETSVVVHAGKGSQIFQVLNRPLNCPVRRRSAPLAARELSGFRSQFERILSGTTEFSLRE